MCHLHADALDEAPLRKYIISVPCSNINTLLDELGDGNIQYYVFTYTKPIIYSCIRIPHIHICVYLHYVRGINGTMLVVVLYTSWVASHRMVAC